MDNDNITVEVLNNKQKITDNTEIIIKGIPSSPGIAIGNSIVFQPESIVIQSERIDTDKVEKELEKFENAIEEVINELQYVLTKVKVDQKNVISILETDILILSDVVFIDSIKSRIQQGFSVESSIIQEFDYQKKLLKKTKDSVLRERANEFDQLKERLLAALKNKCIYYAVTRGSIVVAQSLTPSEIVNFKEACIAGIITEIGGISSHTSILARSFEIPAVIGVNLALNQIPNNVEVILDGFTGTITVNPNKRSKSLYIYKKNKVEEHKSKLGDLVKLPSVTSDGKAIKLITNIDSPDDVRASYLVGAEGVGLVRTEHLIIVKKYFPSEEEQFLWYNEIAERAYPSFVTLRAFDIGSDKFSEGMPRAEANPALGFRGIRFLLHRQDLFKTQIRAILRASKNKNIRFMIPMVSDINEVFKTKALLNECKKELSNENIDFDGSMPFGIMIETPSSAIMADLLAEYSDFFSIGTNDLTQYTLAADRVNDLVTDVYNTFHPSIIKLIKMTASAANKKNIPVGLCGELAGHSAATQLLIGLGINELSVPPPIILELKNRIREINSIKAEALANLVLNCSSVDEISKFLSLS